MELTEARLELIDSRIKRIDPEGKFYSDLHSLAKKVMSHRPEGSIKSLAAWLDTILKNKLETLQSTVYLPAMDFRRPQAEIYGMVTRMCEGDLTELEDIIQSYIPLALSQVYTMSVDVPKEELVCQAYYALTVALNIYPTLEKKCPKAVASYIKTSVKRSLRDFANNYHLIRIPTSTQRDNLENRLKRHSPRVRADESCLDELTTFKAEYEGELEGLIHELELSAEEVGIIKLLIDDKSQIEISDFLHVPMRTLERRIQRIRTRAKRTLLR